MNGIWLVNVLASCAVYLPDDDRTRGWREEIFLVTPTGGNPFFTWGHQPMTGDEMG